MVKVSVAMIVKNEGAKLAKALRSVQWADEIVIVDSGSSDNTLEVAKGFSAKVYDRVFDDFSSQKNFAAEKCGNEWILSLDADEEVSEGLRDLILKTVEDPGDGAAFSVKRVNRLFGKILSHSAGNDYPVRLFRKGKARFVQPIHEYLDVEGRTGRLEEALHHNSTVDLAAEYNKTDRYTDLEAAWILEKNVSPSIFKMLIFPVLMFLKLYVIDRGFLDGIEGLLWAGVSARYCFVKYSKARRLSKDPKYLEKIIAGRFDELARQFPDSIGGSDFRLKGLLDSFGDVRGKTILEIGCGKGRFLGALSAMGARCIGLDVSLELLTKAVKTNAGEYLQASATSLPFNDDSVDYIFCVEVIEHIPGIEKLIEEAARVLRKDGSFAVIDKNALSINCRRYFVPNLLLKKYHEKKNDWMYPKGFAFTEKWFLEKDISAALALRFEKVDARYMMSDSEKSSKIAFLFERLPISRHFLLWKASGPKGA